MKNLARDYSKRMHQYQQATGTEEDVQESHAPKLQV